MQRCLLLIFLLTTIWVNGQTRIYAGAGLLPVKIGLGGGLLWQTHYSALPYLRLEKNINYRYGISTGIGMWQARYNTYGNYLFGYSIADPSRISNRWTQQMIQVPVGLTYYSPVIRLTIGAGVDFNGVLSSMLTDLKNDNGDYFDTDITRDVRRLHTAPYFRFGFRIGKAEAHLNFSFLSGNWHSGKASDAADASALRQQSKYRSFYSRWDFDNLTPYPITYLTIQYRLF